MFTYYEIIRPLPKPGIHAITWRGVEILNRKPQLGGGGEILAQNTKNQLSKHSLAMGHLMGTLHQMSHRQTNQDFGQAFEIPRII